MKIKRGLDAAENTARQGLSLFMGIPLLQGYRERRRPVIKEMMNRTIKTKNRTLATDAAAATILKNPKMPAINATTRKIKAHLNMRSISLS